MNRNLSIGFIICLLASFSWGLRQDTLWVDVVNDSVGFANVYSVTGIGSPTWPPDAEGVRYDDPADDPNQTFVLEAGGVITHTVYEETGVLFGYLATKKKYANYRFRVDYRFDETNDEGFQAYNSGILYHIQSDYIWPPCIESNMYTGHPTAINGIGDDGMVSVTPTKSGYGNGGSNAQELGRDHPAGEWYTMEIEVHGSDLVTHYLSGIEAAQGEDVTFGGDPVDSGNVSIQVEASGISFRNMQIRDFDSPIFWGCTNSDADNFEPEATHDDGSCNATGVRISGNPSFLNITPAAVEINSPGEHYLEVQDIKGRNIFQTRSSGPQTYRLDMLDKQGVYVIHARVGEKTIVKRIFLY
ncbi:family 16 glycoside hydrolase [Fibrobacterota bacterium]